MNHTRFVVVSPVLELRPGRNKISAVFRLPHQSGSLHEILTVFAVQGLNLLKIESRPIPGRAGNTCSSWTLPAISPPRRWTACSTSWGNWPPSSVSWGTSGGMSREQSHPHRHDGCGKSTVGRLAAEQLGLAFVDTDERSGGGGGRTIPELFDAEGEEGFRARELDVSRALAGRGGWSSPAAAAWPTRAEAIAALKASGVVFWLNPGAGLDLRHSVHGAPAPGSGGKRGVSGAVSPAGAHLPSVGGLHHRGPRPGRRGGRAHRDPL